MVIFPISPGLLLTFSYFLVFYSGRLKKPIKDGFNKNAELVKELYEYAEAKSKEAEAKIRKYEEKMNNLEGQVQKIKTEMDQEFSVFKTNLEDETEKKYRTRGKRCREKNCFRKK